MAIFVIIISVIGLIVYCATQSNPSNQNDISKHREYDCFVNTLKNSANDDGINITPIFRKEVTAGTIDLYSLPYIDTDQMCYVHYMKVYLVCSI